MSDRYLEFTHSAFGKQLAALLGLPAPPRLLRATGAYADRPLLGREVLAGTHPSAQMAEPLVAALAASGGTLYVAPDHAGLGPLKAAATAQGQSLKGEPAGDGFSPQAMVFDASGADSAASLRSVYDFFQPRIGRLARHGRVVLVSRAPCSAGSVGGHAASAAIRGFIRALAKEVGRKGATVNLVEVLAGGELHLAGALRFLLSEHAAFITGQTLQVADHGVPPTLIEKPLQDKRALVTGAAHGIGAAIAQTLAREGAQVIGMDRPQEEGALGQTMSRIGGRGLALDVTAPDAADRIVAECGPLDVVVHNAGVTRDKMLRNMPPHLWDMVLDINLGAIERINERLLADGLADGARIVCISSIGGIAGNAGQTNYAATKAGVIGYAEAMAPKLAGRGGAINAVAPGFIETQMTAQMPVMHREVGRRLSSLSQGGLPIDIAEAVTFFACGLSSGLNGQTLRVCGQNFVGA